MSIKSASPSSAFSSSFAVRLGAERLVQQRERMLPSVAIPVSTMDTNMLNTRKTRQIQKWVPAAQTDKTVSDSNCHAVRYVAFVCLCLTDG